MAKKRKILLVAIISIIYIFSAGGCKKKWGTTEPYWFSRQFSKNYLGKLLQDYFSTEDKLTETTRQHFIEYAVDSELFTAFPSPKGYESEGDLSFYLIWPDGLNSKNPQLVAYTQPFNKSNEKDPKIKYRCLLFFRENKPVAIVMSEGNAILLIGNDNLSNNKPALYIWPKYYDYLKDEKAKKTKTTIDTN